MDHKVVNQSTLDRAPADTKRETLAIVTDAVGNSDRGVSNDSNTRDAEKEALGRGGMPKGGDQVGQGGDMEETRRRVMGTRQTQLVPRSDDIRVREPVIGSLEVTANITKSDYAEAFGNKVDFVSDTWKGRFM